MSAHAQSDATATADNATPSGKAILVLDASGSMWARINDEPKIVIARRMVAEMVQQWRNDIHLGLIAYGHREKGNCADIETLMPVAELQADTFLQQVNALNPKGKTPISAAVMQAAQQLRHSEDPATVILVSDGLETCDADPCALGRELAASGVDFTVHVVGFGLSGEDTSALQCLARETGGMYLGADDADQLQAALATAVTRIEAKAQPQGLQLSAALTPEGEALEQGVAWYVYPATTADGASAEAPLIASNISNSQPFITLQPGDYRVVARYGQAQASEMLTVNPAETTTAALVLNAGSVTFTPVARAGGEPITNKVLYTIAPVVDGKTGAEIHRLGSGPGTPVVQTFHLPAGDYLITIASRPVTDSRKIHIVAGESQAHEIVIGTGKATASTLAVVDGPVLQSDLYYWAFARNADGSRGDELARWGVGPGSTPTPTFTLKAGPARIVARWGKAFGEADVDIAADETKNVTIIVNGGRLTVSAVPAAGAEPLQERLAFWVYATNPDGSRGDEVARWGVGPGSTHTPTFLLAEGDYWVGARYRPSDTYAEQTIHITAGQDSTLALVLEGATP